MNGEIEIGELPMVSASGSIVGFRGFDLAREHSNMLTFVADRYSNLPFSIAFMPANSKEFGAFAVLRCSVAGVVFRRSNADVRAPIIKTVMVGVVNKLGVRCAQNDAVHTDGTPDAIASWPIPVGVERMFATDCVPTPLHKPLVIGSIYNRHLALRQRNGAGIGAHRSLPKAAGRGGGVGSARRPYLVYQQPIARKHTGVAA